MSALVISVTIRVSALVSVWMPPLWISHFRFGKLINSLPLDSWTHKIGLAFEISFLSCLQFKIVSDLFSVWKPPSRFFTSGQVKQQFKWVLDTLHQDLVNGVSIAASFTKEIDRRDGIHVHRSNFIIYVTQNMTFWVFRSEWHCVDVGKACCNIYIKNFEFINGFKAKKDTWNSKNIFDIQHLQNI